jgi:SNF2 family DNA or RNA helicase
MVEAQAVDRVHRKGQTRDVTVIRYIVPDSVETVSTPLQVDSTTY